MSDLRTRLSPVKVEYPLRIHFNLHLLAELKPYLSKAMDSDSEEEEDEISED